LLARDATAFCYARFQVSFGAFAARRRRTPRPQQRVTLLVAAAAKSNPKMVDLLRHDERATSF